MANITVSVSEEPKAKIDELTEINWSESVRRFLSEKVRREALLRKLDEMLGKSEITEEEVLKLGEKAKAGMLRKYKAKGW